MRSSTRLAVLLVLGVLVPSTLFADLLRVVPFAMVADRSTLVIKHGYVENHFALVLFFGSAGNENPEPYHSVGLVYAETLSIIDLPKIDEALSKLVAILNDPSTVELTQETLTKRIGLTFHAWVDAVKVKHTPPSAALRLP